MAQILRRRFWIFKGQFLSKLLNKLEANLNENFVSSSEEQKGDPEEPFH